MHEAAKVGDVDILMLLLRNGGRINHKDVTGVTPLAVAAEHGHFQIAEILLSCGQSEVRRVNVSVSAPTPPFLPSAQVAG